RSTAGAMLAARAFLADLQIEAPLLQPPPYAAIPGLSPDRPQVPLANVPERYRAVIVIAAEHDIALEIDGDVFRRQRTIALRLQKRVIDQTCTVRKLSRRGEDAIVQSGAQARSLLAVPA